MGDRDNEFVRAILDSPFDDGPRRVYADWLEDQGDPRAEFLHVQLQFPEVEAFGEDYENLVQREAAAREAVDEEWIERVRRFTTPPAPVDVKEAVPELAPFERIVTRLHPHRTSLEWEPGPSKIGGMFLWPLDEPWPTCPRGLPCVPILQLRKIDVPDVAFPDDCDLMQLFWTAYLDRENDVLPIPHLVWRRANSVNDVAPVPDQSIWEAAVSEFDFEKNVPDHCLLYPEHVAIYPHVDELWYVSDADGIARVVEASPEFVADDSGEQWDLFDLKTCPDWTTGGFRSFVDEGGRDWRHILSLTTLHINRRWLALEDREERGGRRSRNLQDVTGLSFRPPRLSVWSCEDGLAPNVRIDTHD